MTENALVLAAFGSHDGPVWSVAVSPDGTTVASAGDDGTVRLWDAHTGLPRGEWESDRGAVRSVAFRQDSAVLAVGTEDGTILLWSPLAGVLNLTDQQAAPANEPNNQSHGAVRWIAFGPHGTLSAGWHDGSVQAWPASADESRWELADPVLSAVSPDGAQVATVDRDGSVTIWLEVPTNKAGLGIASEDVDQVLSLAVGPDDPVRDLVAIGRRDGSVRVVDGQDLDEELATGVGPALSMAFSPDGTQLAIGGHSGSVQVCGLDPGITRRLLLAAHAGPVRSMAYTPDGGWLVTGADDGKVRVWDLHSGEQHSQIAERPSAVLSVAFSPDGAMLASGGADGLVRLWDTRTGRPARSIAALDGQVLSVAFSPDGATMAAAKDDGTVWRIDLRNGDVGALVALDGPLWQVAFNPAGNQLAIAADGTVQLRDPGSGQMLGHPSAPGAQVLSVAFSPDGRL